MPSRMQFNWSVAPHIAWAIFWLFNIVLALCWPFLHDTFIRNNFAPVYASSCHQILTRCYYLNGEPMPICARCLGVWIGFAIAATAVVSGAPLSSFWRSSFALKLILLFFIDWCLGFIVLPAEWHLERTLTGILGGIGIYILTTLTLARLARRLHFIKGRMDGLLYALGKRH